MKQRLDRLLVERGLVPSREQAQARIMAGDVMVSGQKVAKAGQPVDESASIEVTGLPRYVGRGGLKLEAALQHFGIDPNAKVCIDVGSSTGGFTDCLLQHGAARVYAIDAGTAQLDWKLRNDPRVVVRENCNARYLQPSDIGELAAIVVCDVSFISVTLLLPATAPLLSENGDMVILVKPQFEVGRGQVGSGGVVRDPELHRFACDRVVAALADLGFHSALTDSPILGAEGNREFLLHARRVNR